MSRPGHLVHAEHEARDEGLRRMEDSTGDRDEPLPEPSGDCDGCAACRAIERDRVRLWGAS